MWTRKTILGYPFCVVPHIHSHENGSRLGKIRKDSYLRVVLTHLWWPRQANRMKENQGVRLSLIQSTKSGRWHGEVNWKKTFSCDGRKVRFFKDLLSSEFDFELVSKPKPKNNLDMSLVQLFTFLSYLWFLNVVFVRRLNDYLKIDKLSANNLFTSLRLRVSLYLENLDPLGLDPTCMCNVSLMMYLVVEF